MSQLAFSRAQAAEASSLSEDEIDRAIKRGDLRAKRVGRRVVIPAPALEAWLDSLADA